MKKNIIILTITAALLCLAAFTGLRADDQKPTTSTTTGDSGQCDGSCHKGDKPAPTPTPTPAQ